MPWSPPRLDDMDADTLVSELLARIPAHTPEWTHTSPGDPGRSLIDLFAWLGDTILYRANLIPERQRLVFLKLLGIPMRPAIPARGLVSVQKRSKDQLTPVILQSGAEVSGPPSFETRAELTVHAFASQAYVKRSLSPDERKSLAGTMEDLKTVYAALTQEREGTAPQRDAFDFYVTTPLFQHGAEASGFDVVGDSLDHNLWLALLADKPTQVETLKERIIGGHDGRPYLLNVGVVPSLEPEQTVADLPARATVSHVWEVTSEVSAQGRLLFRSLDVVDDSTRGLTRTGVMTLSLSVGALAVPTNDLQKEASAGVGEERPPRVDDPDVANRIVAWLRMRPTSAINSLRLSWCGVNAVEVEQSRTHRSIIVGQTRGGSDEVIKLPATSVLPDSLLIDVEEGELGFQPYQRVDDVTAYGSEARVYALDAEEGSIRLGDGIRGYLPRVGSRVRLREMRAGGGKAGNLPPQTLLNVTGIDPAGQPTEGLTVLQVTATQGGVDAESLAEAEARIPEMLRHQNRAVTKGDFQALASSTPGLEVGRVEVLPRFKPQQRRMNVPGVVSVMVLPASNNGGAHPPAPRPDRLFLERTHAWLDERRPIGTELYVIGAEYVPVGISVGVEIREGFAREATLSNVTFALRAALWPLPPGGPLGAGYPLGTTVLADQLEVAVAQVPGIAAVRGLRVFGRGASDWTAAPLVAPSKFGLRLEPWQLPELLSVVAVAGADAPDNLRGVPNPFANQGNRRIGVPIVPEVC